MKLESINEQDERKRYRVKIYGMTRVWEETTALSERRALANVIARYVPRRKVGLTLEKIWDEGNYDVQEIPPPPPRETQPGLFD
jgi:hypothetical protein